ncbi:hypothetical protein BYT27DRAFT_7209628 [Phlegmacium glaucopus]|nr:hypothetical protein BYT27DRAFT_7209628 [Phlegmacium glaucopus]
MPEWHSWGVDRWLSIGSTGGTRAIGCANNDRFASLLFVDPPLKLVSETLLALPIGNKVLLSGPGNAGPPEWLDLQLSKSAESSQDFTCPVYSQIQDVRRVIWVHTRIPFTGGRGEILLQFGCPPELQQAQPDCPKGAILLQFGCPPERQALSKWCDFAAIRVPTRIAASPTRLSKGCDFPAIRVPTQTATPTRLSKGCDFAAIRVSTRATSLTEFVLQFGCPPKSQQENLGFHPMVEMERLHYAHQSNQLD